MVSKSGGVAVLPVTAMRNIIKYWPGFQPFCSANDLIFCSMFSCDQEDRSIVDSSWFVDNNCDLTSSDVDFFVNIV